MRVVRDEVRERSGEAYGEEDVDYDVEGDGFAGAEGEEEEVLEEDWLGGEEGGSSKIVVAGCGVLDP